MAHVICQPCVGVKSLACLEVCPSDAIHPKPGEGDFETSDQLFINPTLCNDCGQCVTACPAQAIYHQDSVPSEWASFIQKNADYYGS